MNVGDLVIRKPRWGEWTKHNPWMLTEEDLQVGIVVNACSKRSKRLNTAKACSVLWSDGTFYKYFRIEKLVVINESR